MFTAAGESVIPAEVLYKKPVLVERGSFRPITNVMFDMLERAQEQFQGEPQVQGEAPVVLMEMTLRHLLVGEHMDPRDFLDRVDTLSALGKTVLISNFRRYHRLVGYLSRYTGKMIGLPLGVTRLRDARRKVLRGPARRPVNRSACSSKTRPGLCVYPALDRKDRRVMTLKISEVPPNLRHLYRTSLENGCVRTSAISTLDFDDYPRTC
jgi:hypothetical protein